MENTRDWLSRPLEMIPVGGTLGYRCFLDSRKIALAFGMISDSGLGQHRPAYQDPSLAFVAPEVGRSEMTSRGTGKPQASRNGSPLWPTRQRRMFEPGASRML